VLYAGTIEPRKNLGVLLDAWEALAGEVRLPLVLAGGYGWHSADLVRRMRKLTASGLPVHVLGRLERARLVRVFQAATVFAYPSLYEGFGLPVAESLACGVPAVVSNASSLPEAVGGGGLAVDPHDGGALAAALRRLLAEPGLRAELAARGLAHAATLRWELAAARLDEVFAEALAGWRITESGD
jgi:alpha-1,3-rhamnosyl/mannosyltransferase